VARERPWLAQGKEAARERSRSRSLALRLASLAGEAGLVRLGLSAGPAMRPLGRLHAWRLAPIGHVIIDRNVRMRNDLVDLQIDRSD
jgi:hypothetical protein